MNEGIEMDDFWKLFKNVSIVVAVVAVAVAAGWTVGGEMFEIRQETRERIDSLQRSLEERLVTLEKDAEVKTPVDQPPPAPDDLEQARVAGVDTIRIGETERGRLGADDATLLDGSYFDDWILRVDSVVTVTVEMRSGDLDPVLFLSRGRRNSTDWQPLDGDDDSGDGLSARLVVENLDAGDYTITANTYGRSTGSYTLSVVLVEPNAGSEP